MILPFFSLFFICLVLSLLLSKLFFVYRSDQHLPPFIFLAGAHCVRLYEEVSSESGTQPNESLQNLPTFKGKILGGRCLNSLDLYCPWASKMHSTRVEITVFPGYLLSLKILRLPFHELALLS